MQRSRVPLLPVVTIACCSATMLVVLVGLWSNRSGSLPAKELDALRLVHHQILEEYIAERDPKELVYEAIGGMVSSLDRYSRFIPPDEVRAFEGDEITGTYEGIGVVPVVQRVPFTVRWPFPDGPADRAGIRVGDRILAVGGTPIASYAQAFDLLLGPAGSKATLRVERDAPDGDAPSTFDVDVERGSVQRAAIRWDHLLDTKIGPVGYLWIGEFQQDLLQEFDSCMARLIHAAAAGGGDGLKGLVVDVRGNPGGLLTQAVALANRFVPEGLIVSLKNRAGDVLDRHEARADECMFEDVPLVVLVDRSSASASEVFAAAVQDHGRARIVGERTFGKGVVQQIYSWPGHDFRLKMTSSHYYTPNGRSLARELRRSDRDGDEPGGIDPDVPVARTAEQARAARAALLRQEPPPEGAEAIRELARKLDFEVATPPVPEDDPVLAAAVEVLESGDGEPEDDR